MTKKHVGHWSETNDSGEVLFEIQLDLKPTGPRLSVHTLIRVLKTAIDDGRLAAGSKLPPTRKSATFFGVSRNTAAHAYETLLVEGYVFTRQGSGTYVAERRAPKQRQATSPMVDPRLNTFWTRPDVFAALGFWSNRTEPSRSTSSDEYVEFRPALVDMRLFPFDVFRRVSARALRGLERGQTSMHSPQGNQGNRVLREAIIQHIALTRAVVCDAEDVIVTAGAQQAFDLLARTLVTAGKTVVALEEPGYPPMRVAFAAAGAQLVPVAVDEEGLIVEQVPRDANVICVSPSHQFPLGVTMSTRRRQDLVQRARALNAVIIEDDYDGEFRHEGSPIEALRSTVAADVVFYVGTFSKCMFPSLRLGYVIAPEWALRTLTVAKNSLDWHFSLPVQLAVAGFISDGHLAQHVRRMREIYRRRRARLLSLLHERLGHEFNPIASPYGMHISALSRPGANRDLEAITDALARRDISVHTLARYHLRPPTRQGLVFGYGVVNLAGIERGIDRLCETLAHHSY